MKRLHLQHLGRFGNQLFGVAFALGYAKRHKLKLTMDPWVGQQIFVDLPGVEYCDTPGEGMKINEHNFDAKENRHFHACDDNWVPTDGDTLVYRSYSQCQKCVDYYTRHECKEWFQFRPEVMEQLRGLDGFFINSPIFAHVRRGDFKGYNYPLISFLSYQRACEGYGLNSEPFPSITISDEDPHVLPALPDFLPDFYLLTQAKVLLRANSSFSYWAAVLSDALVLSPVITPDLEGGKEHDVRFVPGNWPRLAAHVDFVTDLHLKEV